MNLAETEIASLEPEIQSVVGHLPGYSLSLDLGTTGAEIEAIFRQSPELPGIALTEEGRLAGAISQSHFFKTLSRGFGREIYYPRPIRIIAQEREPLLTLPALCPIQEAVEHCLQRPEADIYEPFIIREEETGAYCVCSFQTLLLASSRLSALRNRQMEQILGSITEGLLVVDREFRIQREYSKALETIVERHDFAGETLFEFLEPLLGPGKTVETREYFDVLFNARMIDGLIREINPIRRMSSSFPPKKPGGPPREKHFSISFERIRTGMQITQILVRIADITLEVSLAEELAVRDERHGDELEIIAEIFRVDAGQMKRFLEKFDSSLREVEVLMENRSDPGVGVREMFRIVHGLKGDAGILQLGSFETQLHRFEDSLTECRDKAVPRPADLTRLKKGLEELAAMPARLHDAIARLRTLERPAADVPPPPPVAPPVPTGPVEELSGLISDLEKRTGKKAIFKTTIRDSEIPSCFYDVLREVLPHLARNSVVHGIESEEERRRQGKPAAGTIQLGARRHAHALELIFQDDGAGLDPQKLRRRAEEMAISLPAGTATEELIFFPGFSTVEIPGMLAGRGVGMDAVRHALKRQGGTIIPHSQVGTFCAFQILLPNTQPGENPK